MKNVPFCVDSSPPEVQKLIKIKLLGPKNCQNGIFFTFEIPKIDFT